MQKKERAEKDLVVRVQPSLFKKFQKKCDEDYKTVSQVIREMMLRYIHAKKNETNERIERNEMRKMNEKEKEHRTEM